MWNKTKKSEAQRFQGPNLSSSCSMLCLCLARVLCSISSLYSIY